MPTRSSGTTDPPSIPAGKRVWIDGQLVPSEQATVSVFDHGVLYGDGVFEGIRVYNGRVFKLATHIKRLHESARAIRLDLPYTADQIAEAVRATVLANQQHNGYVRLCVTRGPGTLGLTPFRCPRPVMFIIADDIRLYPEQMYSDGMAIITASTIRNHPAALSPRIKSLNYLNNILAKIEAIDAGVMEAVMLNAQGFVAECTADNIFIVRQDDRETVVRTPPLHAGILDGITKQTVEHIARAAGLRMEATDMTRHDLYTADEVFITGSAAEIMPVTQIDGRTILDGKPGPITRKLIEAFHQLVSNDAPED
ncbi:branched-chain-amino-acid transaminase [Mucisphaera calidilacus]|uniref:branched-chain-amino-acid transaminase n=1 Tax=Mucisphaera calidilacus TaxID=2527982 RepID=UPI0037043D3E